MVLDPSEARSYYDRFGKKQDTQSFYEDRALDDLIEHARFEEAESVFEFGCGTGRFASRLLKEFLPSSATYLGCDLSSTMVNLARDRLAGYGERVDIVQSDGGVKFPLADRSVDRVVSTYVLDLLSEQDIAAFFEEAYRVLNVSGRICLVSLTRGTTAVSKIVSGLWNSVFRMRASLVGGCRPIKFETYVDPERWKIEYRNVVVAFGVPSEVLVARMVPADRRL